MHRPDTLDWQNSRALAGGLADAIRALKDLDDDVNLLTQGSSDMVRQLLAESTNTPTGVLVTRHLRSGEVCTGAFE